MWQHKGFKIEVDTDGMFVAESEEERFQANSLDSVKRIIDKSASKLLKKRAIALPVIVLLGDLRSTRSFSPAPNFIETTSGTITGFNRTSRSYTGIQIPPERAILDVIPDTEFNRQLVIRVLKVREEWGCVEGALRARLMGAKVDSYNTIEPSQYETVLQKVEEKHRKALAEDKKPGLQITQIG